MPSSKNTRGALADDAAVSDRAMELLVTKICSNLVMQLEATIDNKLSKLNDNLTEVVKEMNSLNDKITNNAAVVSNAFRLGKAESAAPNKPRGILVSFVQNIKRNEIFEAKRLLKNTAITVYEDLTARRYEILIQARKKFGPKNVWSMGGNVFAWCDKDKKKLLIKSMNDILTL
ncbi:hypothetical protein NQ315_015523 [Exocentrus adspersus]|uniref:Uncharacterized protein n=1 Tax=Exocentrus adspersus TaxID=1586481 RepID=A0AAV8VNU2_9CUCU|nr:hypothetical protein NQ315_015523 [Exocentrus adspersus]